MKIRFIALTEKAEKNMNNFADPKRMINKNTFEEEYKESAINWMIRQTAKRYGLRNVKNYWDSPKPVKKGVEDKLLENAASNLECNKRELRIEVSK